MIDQLWHVWQLRIHVRFAEAFSQNGFEEIAR